MDDLDPDIAATMGFAGFGAQPNQKKRKHGHFDAIVDISATAAAAADARFASGANGTAIVPKMVRVPAGKAAAGAAAPVLEPAFASVSVASSGHAGRATGTGVPLSGRPKADAVWAAIKEKSNVEELDRDELDALRKGVRNEDGDMVYFKPSFVEDPWASFGGGDGGDGNGGGSGRP